MQIKIKTPAKINYTLEIVSKRNDGFHEIQSIMQMINLYDFLTFDVSPSNQFMINLSGTNNEIPYDDKNIVYKAIKLFSDYINAKPCEYNVFIEKNIPTEAGLAGGSSNAVGIILAMNKYYNNILSINELHKLCSKLGSDLNVILIGGCVLAKGRGEIVSALPYQEYPVSLIKPNMGISAKEGYKRYSDLPVKPNLNNTSKMLECLKIGSDIKKYLYNDLETAVFNYYPELQAIKLKNPNAVMSGSGSTYFTLEPDIIQVGACWSMTGLKTIASGCEFI
ncbi:4-(cytidine 5'-diphospho)-2-C-methyl-D-erythritol kinase [bacterium]|nr:4-(cytidine 5'-diphospho)-2-C-methyl-D-erythritol kinase [bacterium]